METSAKKTRGRVPRWAMKSTASLLSGTQRPGSSVPASICSDLKLGSWTANAAHSVLSESQSWNQRVALSQSHGQIFTQLASQACSPRSGQPLHSKQPAAGQATVPQRLVKLLSYSKLRLLQELRAHQLVSDDEEEGASARRQLKKPTRGPLSEGNRPRQIWALEEVQVLELEILGVAGLNLFDEHGELKVDPKTREPYKKLQGRYAEDARDLLESLLRANHADNFYVQRLEQEAGHQEHILKSEGVRRQLIRLMDRLLRHMEALDIEPDRQPGEWRVRMEKRHQEFIRSHLPELTEFVPVEERRYPSQEIRFTHFDSFIKAHSEHLPLGITSAFLRMYVHTEADQELPLEVWSKHTNDCKRRIDEKAGRDVLLLPPGWERPTAQQLANIVRMFKCAHPLRKDVRLRFAMSASNRFSEHYGLSVASIDKIEDGSTSCGYRIYLPKYREFLARFEADPGGFYLTFNMAQQMGNIQLSILFDNLAKGEGDFRLYSAFMVEIGQFDLNRYAKYFELSVEKAQQDVDELNAKSRAFIAGNVKKRSGTGSWQAQQFRRTKGSRTLAKGRQLGEHVTTEHLLEMLAFQKQSCHYTGITIYPARGGRLSPHAACVELVGERGAFKLASMWLARGVGGVPLEVREAFFAHWGLQELRYVAYLQRDARGRVIGDPYEEKCLEIIGREEQETVVGGLAGEVGAEKQPGGVAGDARGEGSSEARCVDAGQGSGQADKSGRSGTHAEDPPPLPFGRFHGSWGAPDRLLERLTAHWPPPSPRYRRQGLTLDAAPPSLEYLMDDRRDDGGDVRARSRTIHAMHKQGEAACEESQWSSSSVRPGRGLGGPSLTSSVSGSVPGEAEAKTSAALRATGLKAEGTAPAFVKAQGPRDEPMLVEAACRAASAPTAAAAAPGHLVVDTTTNTVKPSRLEEVDYRSSRFCKSRELERDTTVLLSDNHEPNLTPTLTKDAQYPGLPALLPPGSTRRVSIGDEEMDRLQPGKWLCTKIVDFYCIYLFESRNVDVSGVLCAQPGLFEKLHRLVRGSCLMSTQKFAAEIEKTLKNYGLGELFSAHTVFIPVYFRSHFSLALLRFPVNAGGYMILLNSLPNTHAGVEKTLRKVLPTAWATRSQPSGSAPRRFAPEDLPSFYPDMPLQPNESDCALFMLHNLELLLEDTSLVEKMRTDSNMRNLYDPVVAVQKRAALRAIICQLVAGPGASNVTTSGYAQSAPVSLSPARQRVAPLPVTTGIYSSTCDMEDRQPDQLGDCQGQHKRPPAHPRSALTSAQIADAQTAPRHSPAAGAYGIAVPGQGQAPPVTSGGVFKPQKRKRMFISPLLSSKD